METWEYKTVKLPVTGFTGGEIDTEKFTDKLNSLGAKGWELISCFTTNQSYGSSRYGIAVLKRRVE